METRDTPIHCKQQPHVNGLPFRVRHHSPSYLLLSVGVLPLSFMSQRVHKGGREREKKKEREREKKKEREREREKKREREREKTKNFIDADAVRLGCGPLLTY